jgi:CBS domain containing-hemolysin-like protein
MGETIIWLGILFCLTQSAIFSGLNLAFFSLTRLRLEIAAEDAKSTQAIKVLNMRKDSNFLLTTILWGNVGINVLLTLLTDSVLTGIASFAFSTGAITFFGEIIPQAYFSRNALRMASALAPVLKFYQILMFPIAKPCALILDAWLGKESISYFSEENIKLFIRKHIEETRSEIDEIEGTGAINFLSLDDNKVIDEGESINPLSVVSLPTENEEVVFPDYRSGSGNTFINLVNRSGEKWIIITNSRHEPVLVLDADGFLRSSLLTEEGYEPIQNFCHVPLVIKDENINLGKIIKMLKTGIERHSDSPIDIDVILFWTAENKRIITGADLLGRLLKGI